MGGVVIPDRNANNEQVIRSKAFSDSEGFRFRGASFSGEIPANSTASIDYRIAEERFINGGKVMVKNQGDDDTVSFQVVDVDNVLGFGSGVVLDNFVNNFYLPTNESLAIQLDYPARIIAGLYLRMIYTNTNPTLSAKIKCNLYLHRR